ncbi:MAG TPA: MucB/RseB C-terminal domain-containing protein [Gammaproteobacteria bacterium]|nr:MucB/RseB C-terminal domain-containing protein [Gammaproteobacteria bacterium]
MMSRKATGLAIVWCGLFGALPAFAASDTPATPVSVPALLQRMTHALESLNYTGNFVYLHQGELEAMHVVHRVDAQGDEERLTSLTGTPREVIRKHQSVECVLPRKQIVIVHDYRPESPFPIILSPHSDTRDLSKYYQLKRLGHQRTAGRDCVVVALQPKDDYRYGYRLWLDSKTNLLLRSELVDAGGTTIERVMFTHVELPDKIPPGEIKPSIDTRGFARRPRDAGQAPPGTAQTVTLKVDNLPPGYKMTVDEMQHLADIDAPVRHLVFTDGLASLSVFATPHKDGKDALRGPSSRGPVNAYGRLLDGYQITVVGEVPAATVKLVAQSVEIDKRE